MPLKTPRQISIEGARVHNLRNLTFRLPHNAITVVSGLSGSGKSTLAFDLLFAEGQRRFLDCMSPYARYFAHQLERPEVDRITGLPPTVAIEQHVSRGAGKSTVATVTELYHFLRLLYARLGIQHCPQSGVPVVSRTVTDIERTLAGQIKEEAPRKGKLMRLLAPAVRGRKGFHQEVAQFAEKCGYQELYIDGTLIPTSEFKALARFKEHDIDYVTATIRPGAPPEHLSEHLGEALAQGKGTVRLLDTQGQLHPYSTSRVSPATGRSFPEPDPAHFSFNSSRGWCPNCRGFGTVPAKSGTRLPELDGRLSQAEAELNEELTGYGESSELVTCPECEGARINEMARHIRLVGTTLPELARLSVNDALRRISKLQFKGREALIARDILPELTQRLRFLQQIGLGYLQLDRSANTLSGGESQRIRLAAQLGSNLRGVLYVLDEPTIGLHPRDNQKLLDTLDTLCSKGNTLLIVEHDEDTIRRAHHLLDLGPAAGKHGGRIIYQGSPFPSSAADSLTLASLREPLNHPLRQKRRNLPAANASQGWFRLKGCTHNNLKGIDVRIPHECLTVLTGVSGCGKSSLLRGCLLPASLHAASPKVHRLPVPPPFREASGFDSLKSVYQVDQSPIGKTSRSCPATYVKIFDDIRKLFAQLPEARMKGFDAGRFSFNNKTGQCPTCKGNGNLKIEMDFLPASWASCPTCHGQRYNAPTLEVYYQGHNISQILQLTIAEAASIFENHSRLHRTLSLLADAGLGYLQLGQPSPTLSGGEAQRLKLAAELAKGRGRPMRTGKKSRNLYLIEEPTIGLHLQDVRLLIDLLHRLVDEGHSVVVIEHHMNLAAEADFVIDLGPEAGDEGGRIVCQGSPEHIAQSAKSRTAPYLAKVLNPG